MLVVYTCAYDDSPGLERLGRALEAQPHVDRWAVGLARWHDFPDGRETAERDLLIERDRETLHRFTDDIWVADRDWDERDWRTRMLRACTGLGATEIVMLDSDETPVRTISPLYEPATVGMVEHGEQSALGEWQPSGWAKYVRQWRPLDGDRYWPRHAELRRADGTLRHWSATWGPDEVTVRCPWQIAHWAPTGLRWKQKRARYQVLQQRERTAARGKVLDMPPVAEF